MERKGPAAIVKKVLFTLFAWAIVLLVVFPLVWMTVTAFKPETELFIQPPTFLPLAPTVQHFLKLLLTTPFPIYARNSVIVSVLTTMVVIVVATLGAHSLVKFNYRGRTAVAQMILFTYLLPSVVLVIPLYLMFARLGLTDSLASLVTAYTTFALPFALWLLRSFMAAIPPDLEFAAMVDGASRMRAFVDVILPQALPGIISTSLFTFINAWNEYLYALVLINRDVQKTLPPGVIVMLVTGFNIEWSLLMAAAAMMAIPLLVVFVFMQKHLTRGFGAGAVKG
ncbi:MAG: carbohydrate ABC transporter permease [Planctomycetota bacterium]|nr:carbohydrate ABC transporter permease [Planctomycetota bacterium]